jgi:hypothetical protein
MKYLLATVLCIGAAGCGSAGATSTVTTPPKTVHVTNTTTALGNDACRKAMEELIDMNGLALDSAQAISNGDYSKGSAKLESFTAKAKEVKPLVDLCRAIG